MEYPFALLPDIAFYGIKLYLFIIPQIPEKTSGIAGIQRITPRFFITGTPSVSRVLSCMTIYLGAMLPLRSSHLLTKRAEQTRYPPHQSVLHRVGFTWRYSLLHPGELLPRLSTLTAFAAVYLCCTCPKVALG